MNRRNRKEKGQAVVSAATVAFLILLVVAYAAYASIDQAPEAARALETVMQSLPLSNHALDKQLNITWDVEMVTRWMEQGNCNPITVQVCRDNITKYLCPLAPGATGPKDLYAGIITGQKTWDGNEIVITGWIAPWKTWERLGRRDGCTTTTMPGTWMMP